MDLLASANARCARIVSSPAFWGRFAVGLDGVLIVWSTIAFPGAWIELSRLLCVLVGIGTSMDFDTLNSLDKRRSARLEGAEISRGVGVGVSEGERGSGDDGGSGTKFGGRSIGSSLGRTFGRKNFGPARGV